MWDSQENIERVRENVKFLTSKGCSCKGNCSTADASAQSNIKTVEPIANALTVRIHIKMGSANGTAQIYI